MYMLSVIVHAMAAPAIQGVYEPPVYEVKL